MKLGLGTVQFGSAYGAFNRSGRPDTVEIECCLGLAAAAGVEIIDTARAYQDSEAVLGRLRAPERFSIVTKIPRLGSDGVRALNRSVDASLAALRTDRLYGLMLHSADDLLGDQGASIWKGLEQTKETAGVERLGASVYHPEQAHTLLDRYPVGLLQVPFNVFDRRFAESGVFERCAAADTEVHVRSVFLQGLTLQNGEDLPPGLAGFREPLRRFALLCDEIGISQVAASLACAFAQTGISAVLVGIERADQLTTILAEAKFALPTLAKHFGRLAVDDQSLLNPANWQARG